MRRGPELVRGNNGLILMHSMLWYWAVLDISDSISAIASLVGGGGMRIIRSAFDLAAQMSVVSDVLASSIESRCDASFVPPWIHSSLH